MCRRPSLKLEGKDASELQKQIKGLKRKLNKEKNKNSAPRSERRKGHRGKKKRPEDKKPETGGKRTEQPELAFVEATSTLDDSDRRCEKSNGVATPIAGGDTTEVVTVIERIFRIKSVTRQKYVHGCNCKAVEKVVSAPGPQKVVAKGRYSVLFAVDDHLPFTGEGHDDQLLFDHRWGQRSHRR